MTFGLRIENLELVIERGRERVGLGSWRRYIVTTCILPRDFERARRNKGVTWRYEGVTGNAKCRMQSGECRGKGDGGEIRIKIRRGGGHRGHFTRKVVRTSVNTGVLNG